MYRYCSSPRVSSDCATDAEMSARTSPSRRAGALINCRFMPKSRSPRVVNRRAARLSAFQLNRGFVHRGRWDVKAYDATVVSQDCALRPKVSAIGLSDLVEE